jgi:mono/diheme cytochrome c family protein
MKSFFKIKMKTRFNIVSVFAIAVILITAGCYYDNEEDLYPGSGGCDTTNVTYSATIAPVFAGYCNSCHSGSNPSGNIVTDNYNSVKSNMSRIHGAINHQSGYTPMPKDSGKLSDCDLAKIDIWIRQGMPNN